MLSPSPTELELRVRTHLAQLRNEAESARRVSRSRVVTGPWPRFAATWRRVITWLRPRRRQRGRPAARATGMVPTSRTIR